MIWARCINYSSRTLWISASAEHSQFPRLDGRCYLFMHVYRASSLHSWRPACTSRSMDSTVSSSMLYSHGYFIATTAASIIMGQTSTCGKVGRIPYSCYTILQRRLYLMLGASGVSEILNGCHWLDCRNRPPPLPPPSHPSTSSDWLIHTSHLGMLVSKLQCNVYPCYSVSFTVKMIRVEQ